MSAASSERTAAERITLVISVLILVSIFSLAGWAHWRAGNAPPTIRVQAQLDQVRETESGFYVPITITNTGALTAQDVTVTGALETSGGRAETAEITINFLAGGELEYGELVFRANPNAGRFTVGPSSFVRP